MFKRAVLLFIASLFITSCLGSIFSDPADAFVGDYSYTNSYFVRWGGDSKSSTITGYFSLTKISYNTVQMTGAWTTTGTVTVNTVRFDICPQSDSKGYVTYTFGSGRLSGNTLSFSYTGSGSVKYSLVAYPWEESGNVTATRQ